MKKLTIVIILLLAVACTFAQDVDWFSFKWLSAKLSGKKFDKAAIVIPVGIDHMHHQFLMQFDMGSNATVIYGNPIKPYLHRKDHLAAKLDTTESFMWNDKKNYTFKGIYLELNKVSLGKKNVPCLSDYSQKHRRVSLLAFFPKLVGTIGTDIFQDKVLIIDYPNKRICATNALPLAYAQASFIPFKVKYNHIIITLIINGKPVDVMYDTGSSIFELMTTEKNAQTITEGDVVDSIAINSWGKKIMTYGRQMKGAIKMGDKMLKAPVVYYDTINKTDRIDAALDTWGITGNTYFLDNVVIIDWKNKRFGVM